MKVAESARGRQNGFGQFWAREFGHEATVMPSGARGRATGGSRGETEAKAVEERGKELGFAVVLVSALRFVSELLSRLEPLTRIVDVLPEI